MTSSGGGVDATQARSHPCSVVVLPKGSDQRRLITIIGINHVHDAYHMDTFRFRSGCCAPILDGGNKRSAAEFDRGCILGQRAQQTTDFK
jgi:hypothetical protein